jgi:integrase
VKKDGYTVRADGRLQTSITDPRTGKRIYFYGATARELKRKIFEHKQREEESKKFEFIAEEWWEEAEPNLALQSIRGYKQAKNQAIAEFKDINITTIQPKDVSNYLRKLSRRYTSQKTIARFRLILNLIFKYAVERGEIQYNPCDAANTPKGLETSKREAASEEDEAIIKNDTDNWLFPFFAIYSGMRKGEILALQWKDIDFENDLINVYKSISHDGDRPIVKKTKTGRSRVVPLLNPLKERLIKIEFQSKENYIFSDDGINPLTNRRYITLYKNYKKATGINCTAHQLRHSFATIAFENGIDPKIIQEILGHKQISTTMDIYTDMRNKHMKNVTQLLNEKIK